MHFSVCYMSRKTLWPIKTDETGTAPAVQYLGLHASTAADVGLIPSQGTKTPYAVQPKKKKN